MKLELNKVYIDRNGIQYKVFCIIESLIHDDELYPFVCTTKCQNNIIRYTSKGISEHNKLSAGSDNLIELVGDDFTDNKEESYLVNNEGIDVLSENVISIYDKFIYSFHIADDEYNYCWLDFIKLDKDSDMNKYPKFEESEMEHIFRICFQSMKEIDNMIDVIEKIKSRYKNKLYYDNYKK